MNLTWALLTLLLPPSAAKNWLLRRHPGWDIHRTAEIGHAVIWRVERLEVLENARIGPLSVVKGLQRLHLAKQARLGQLNWVTAAEWARADGQAKTLIISAHAAVTNRHYLDCTGGIRIGAYTTMAGVRSTLITHGIDTRRSAQTTQPIQIGEYCLIARTSALCQVLRFQIVAS